MIKKILLSIVAIVVTVALWHGLDILQDAYLTDKQARLIIGAVGVGMILYWIKSY